MSQRGEYRAVFSVLVDTEEFQALSPDARLLWFIVKMSLSASGIGLLFDDQLRDRSGLTEARLNKARAELGAGLWLLVQGRVHWLRNGLRYEPHMSLANENHKAFIAKETTGLPRLAIVREFARYYSLPDPFPGGPVDTKGDGMGDGMPDHTTPLTLSLDPIPSVKSTVGSGKKKRRPIPTYSAEFLELWAVHKQGGKAEAFTEYGLALESGVEHGTILRGLRAYVKAKVRPDFDGAHLFRWLRDRRWEAYTDTLPAPTPPPRPAPEPQPEPLTPEEITSRREAINKALGTRPLRTPFPTNTIDWSAALPPESAVRQ